jgi:hypothetical protein
VFAFLASFDETIVSFFISGVENKTVTRKLFEDIDFNLSPVIAAVSTIFVVVTPASWTGSTRQNTNQGTTNETRRDGGLKSPLLAAFCSPCLWPVSSPCRSGDKQASQAELAISSGVHRASHTQ